MTTELYWLTLTTLLTGLLWLPYLIDRLAVRGLWRAVSDTQPETGERHSLWAKRAMRAHHNAVENLVVFAPAVLIAHVLQISTPVTRAAVVAYFLARLVHYLVYAAGVPVVRTLAFALGWGAQMALLGSILGWL